MNHVTDVLFVGDLLMSTGDDGTVRSWKRGADSRWHEYSEIDVKSLQDS